jgi:glyoxylase-like metal-dependent hydrolase (beta-lactamase superfamily II)
MKLSDRCYAVTGLGYSAPWSVNAGFVVGDDTTLVVDTGASALSGSTVHGYASAVRSGNALRVINTEKHFDHIGGNCVFRAQGVPIAGHLRLRRTAEEFAAERADFNREISNAARRARGEQDVFFAGTTLTLPDLPLEREVEWDLGGCVARVLVTPGHTETNLCVWVPGDGVLYAGDCLINGYLPNLDAGRPQDWAVWLRSLDRVEALRPGFVMCGHGPVAVGEEVARIIGEVRAVLLTAIEQGRSPTASNG